MKVFGGVPVRQNKGMWAGRFPCLCRLWGNEFLRELRTILDEETAAKIHGTD